MQLDNQVRALVKQYAMPHGPYRHNDADTKWQYLVAAGHTLHHFEGDLRQRRRIEEHPELLLQPQVQTPLSS